MMGHLIFRAQFCMEAFFVALALVINLKIFGIIIMFMYDSGVLWLNYRSFCFNKPKFLLKLIFINAFHTRYQSSNNDFLVKSKKFVFKYCLFVFNFVVCGF